MWSILARRSIFAATRRCRDQDHQHLGVRLRTLQSAVGSLSAWAANPDGEHSLTLLAARRRLMTLVLPMLAALSMGAWWSTRSMANGLNMSFWLPAAAAAFLMLVWLLMVSGRLHPHRAAMLMCASLALVILKRFVSLNQLYASTDTLPAFMPIFAFIPVLMITGFLVLPARWALWNATVLMATAIAGALPMLVGDGGTHFGAPQLMLFLFVGLPIVVVSLWALSESEGFREDAFRLAELQHEAQARSEALQRANQGLEAFNYAISHDLRAPLRTISGFMGLILKRHGQEMTPEMRELFELSVDASQELGRMTTCLLDYARAGSEPAQEGDTDVADVVDEVTRHLQADIEAQGAQVSMKASQSLPFNRAALRQVLQNLIENAIKYRHPVRAPRIQVEAGRRGDQVWLRVCDNGLGVAPDQRRQIFEPFRRADGVSGPGLGIGLSTCHRLVSARGGKIEVEPNTQGQGSCFVIRLHAPTAAS